MSTQLDRRPPASTAQSDTLKPSGLLTLLTGIALPVIDFFIVNVALSTIQADLHASAATLEMVVASYGIAYALLLVVGGRLGDALGRRRLFTIGLSAFTVSSLACGLAPSAGVLVSARAAQGAAAAMIMPQGLSTIQATTSGEHRSKAIGIYGATGGLSTVVGQLIGGLLVAANIAGTGWRPIFLINVPIGLFVLLIVRRTLPETRASKPVGVDRVGTALLGISLLSLLIPLMEGRALGWPAWCQALLVVFPFAAGGFLAFERRFESAGGVPLLPPSLLRMPSMRRGLGTAVPFFSGFGAFMFVYAITLQDGLGLGALGSGLALTPMAVAFFAASLVSGRLVTRFGRLVVLIGTSIQLFGVLLLIGIVTLAWPNLDALILAPAMLAIGSGQGLTMPTLFRVVLSKVPAEQAGAGSGVLTTTQQTSLALGVAVLGSLYTALSLPDSLGLQGAFTVVLASYAVLIAIVLGFGRKLPDPRA